MHPLQNKLNGSDYVFKMFILSNDLCDCHDGV